jgi:HEPN domain-containing protein
MTLKRVKAVLQIAEEELSAAKRLQAPLPRQAQYFLQQSVEKMIRATLEASEIPAGTAHSLSFLAGLLPQSHPLRARFTAFEHLSGAATRYRYPTGTGVVHNISSDEVLAEVTRVAQLREEVLAYLIAEGFR